MNIACLFHLSDQLQRSRLDECLITLLVDRFYVEVAKKDTGSKRMPRRTCRVLVSNMNIRKRDLDVANDRFYVCFKPPFLFFFFLFDLRKVGILKEYQYIRAKKPINNVRSTFWGLVPKYQCADRWLRSPEI